MKKKTPFTVLGQKGKLPSGRYWMEADGELMISTKNKEENWRWFYRCKRELDPRDITELDRLEGILDNEDTRLIQDGQKAAEIWIDEMRKRGQLDKFCSMTYQEFRDAVVAMDDPAIYNENMLSYDGKLMDYSVIKDDLLIVALDTAWDTMEQIYSRSDW